MISESIADGNTISVVLYARVSTDDKGQNPDVQLDILRNLAKSRGYRIVNEYVDYASGKDGNRPQFIEMMNAAKKHEFDAIMALRVDRIMRSVLHLRNVITDLLKYRVKLILTDMEFDPENPTSNLILNVVSSIAEWEREIIAQRTKEGMNHARSKGSRIGRPKAEIPLTRVARMRIEGMSWSTISKETGISKSTLLGYKEAVGNRISELTSDS